MKKSQVVESLKNQMDSFYSLEQVIKIVESIEDETSIITKETLSELVDNIRQVLDRNSDELIDKDSAEFEINYDNRIELSSAEFDIDCIIDHIEDVLKNVLKK